MWFKRLNLLFLAIGISLSGVDSAIAGAVLKNGVKVGDRSRMHIVRKPKPGQPFVVPALRARAVPPRQRRGTGPRQAWFWQRFTPAASAAAPARWDQALQTMTERRAQGAAIMSSATAAAVAASFGPQIVEAARAHKVSEALILAVIMVESAGSPKAQSPKGAQGLMQLIPATAKRFGVANSFDPHANIMGGTAYLAWLLETFGEDPLLALAGYNAGEGAVREYKGVPPYAETRDYVVKVLDAVVAAREVCGALPESPRGHCPLVSG